MKVEQERESRPGLRVLVLVDRELRHQKLRSVPPTLILQGEKDSVTPAEGAITFCERMVANNNICVLKLYRDVGHVFTRNLRQQDDYSSIDQEISSQASEASVFFLQALGFLK